MKIACWVLLVLAAAALLCSIGAKSLSAQHLFGFLPGAWWKLAMAFAVFAMAVKIVAGEGRPAA
ncbi:MAG: hypothetical protein LAO51_17975 [Acidobacteriia bacterium]|nr:hypothetical protein [Terriglobia bacterium]